MIKFGIPEIIFTVSMVVFWIASIYGIFVIICRILKGKKVNNGS